MRDTEAKNAAAEIKRITEEIKDIDAKVAPLQMLRDAGKLSGDEENQLVELKRKWAELTADEEADHEEARLLQSIRETESKIAALQGTAYQSALIDDMAEKSAELKALYGEYEVINGLINSIKPGYQCPSCFMEITENNLTAAKNALLSKRQTCVANGTQAKNNLNAVKKRDETAKQAFDMQKETQLAGLNTQLQQLQQQAVAHEASQTILVNQMLDTINKVHAGMEVLNHKKRAWQLNVGTGGGIITVVAIKDRTGSPAWHESGNS